MNWRARYARSVEADIDKLPRDIRTRFIAALPRLLTNPLAGKKLKGAKDRYSIRMGRDYRVVYTVFKTNE